MSSQFRWLGTVQAQRVFAIATGYARRSGVWLYAERRLYHCTEERAPS